MAADSKIQLASKQAAELACAIGDILRDDLRDVIPTATQCARVQGLDNEGRTLKTDLRQALETLENTKAELQELADELASLGAQIVPRRYKRRYAPSMPAAIPRRRLPISRARRKPRNPTWSCQPRRCRTEDLKRS